MRLPSTRTSARHRGNRIRVRSGRAVGPALAKLHPLQRRCASRERTTPGTAGRQAVGGDEAADAAGSQFLCLDAAPTWGSDHPPASVRWVVTNAGPADSDADHTLVRDEPERDNALRSPPPTSGSGTIARPEDRRTSLDGRSLSGSRPSMLLALQARRGRSDLAAMSTRPLWRQSAASHAHISSQVGQCQCELPPEASAPPSNRDTILGAATRWLKIGIDPCCVGRLRQPSAASGEGGPGYRLSCRGGHQAEPHGRFTLCRQRRRPPMRIITRP
jgi:hypothetical protein